MSAFELPASTPTPKPTLLQQRVERELRWYPARWRRAHGAALAGTVLDVVEAEGRDALTPAEVRDLRINGLRQRGAVILPARSRGMASALALGGGGALAAIQLVFLEWAPWFGDLHRYAERQLLIDAGFGPFVSGAAVVDLLWLVGFVLGMLRWRVAMMVAFAASMAVSIALVTAPITPWNIARPSATTLAVLTLLAISASIGSQRAVRFSPLYVLAGVALTAAPVLIWGGQRLEVFWSRSLDQILNPGLIATGALALILAFDLLGADRAYGDALLLSAGPAWVVLAASSPDAAGWIPMGVGTAAVAVVALILMRSANLRLRFARAVSAD
ncbi:hypothetical protein [Schumannella soli]|uniref:Uncharacterized protein n=1 Tax=Schumannella soli TaxID=2590779 RepID=A0A506Y8N4_9MICO|nr:hypothetical protein [Schumannella soli]TPW77850.1 hypothetical protein FJ657_04170 [Schumannella soli]